MKKYLSGMECDPFEGIPDIHVTKHHINGWRYFATYRNGRASKQLIFKKLAGQGIVENPGSWDWHHVVEGKNLAPLFSLADYNQLYMLEWPTVLMHSAEEHKILNRLFRSKSILSEVQNAGGKPLTGLERHAYIKALRQYYQDVYLGDHVLRKIAHNFFSMLF